MSGELQRAFEADPTPQSARAFLSALAREGEPIFAELLALAEDASRPWHRLLRRAEALEAPREVVWRALDALLSGWPDALRRFAPRHLRAAVGAEAPRPAPPLPRSLGRHPELPRRGHDPSALIAAHPQLREARLDVARLRPLGAPLLRRLALVGEADRASVQSLAASELPALEALEWELAYSSKPAPSLAEVPWLSQLTCLRAWQPLYSRALYPAIPRMPLGPWPALEVAALPLDALGPAASLAERFPRLRELELYGPELDGASAELERLAGLPLRELSLRGFDPGEVSAALRAGLTEGLRGLRSAIPSDAAAIPPLPELRSLEWSAWGDAAPPSAAPAEVLAALARAAPGLDSLRLASSEPAAAEAFARQGPWPVTELGWPRKITAAGLAAVLDACPRLARLDLGTHRLSPALLEVLRGRELTSLKAHFAGDVADLGAAMEELEGIARWDVEVYGDLPELLALLASPAGTRLERLSLTTLRRANPAELEALCAAQAPHLEALTLTLVLPDWSIGDRLLEAPGFPRLERLSLREMIINSGYDEPWMS